MLLNGTHLLPDPSGAVIWPRQGLIAVSDPIGDTTARSAPQIAAAALRRLASLLRQRQPVRVMWLGGALLALLNDDKLGKRESTELARMMRAHAWTWVNDADVAVEGLTFRRAALPGNVLGEIAAEPSPVATSGGRTWPCFVTDGRRLIIPAFGGMAPGINVLSPPFQPLFRRPFQALMLADGRILTRPRARLEAPPA